MKFNFNGINYFNFWHLFRDGAGSFVTLFDASTSFFSSFRLSFAVDVADADADEDDDAAAVCADVAGVDG